MVQRVSLATFSKGLPNVSDDVEYVHQPPPQGEKIREKHLLPSFDSFVTQVCRKTELSWSEEMATDEMSDFLRNRGFSTYQPGLRKESLRAITKMISWFVLSSLKNLSVNSHNSSRKNIFVSIVKENFMFSDWIAREHAKALLLVILMLYSFPRGKQHK